MLYIVFVVQNLKAVPVERKKYGHFDTDLSYIVLQVNELSGATGIGRNRIIIIILCGWDADMVGKDQQRGYQIDHWCINKFYFFSHKSCNSTLMVANSYSSRQDA